MPVSAQQYTIEKIGLEEGMPSARVNDILEDSRGFFWIGTEGAGLLRFDGYEFVKLDPGLPLLQPIVSSIAEDEDGNLWFAMEKALLRYDGIQFTPYYLPGTPDRIIDIVFNKGTNPTVATRSKLFQLNESDTLAELSYPLKARIHDIQWHHDDLWVATGDGLYHDQEKIAEGAWNSIALYEDKLMAQSFSAIWYAGSDTLGKFRGRFLAARKEVLVSLRNDSLILQNADGTARITGVNGLPDEDYKGCYIDAEGVVWLYSNSGLYKIPGTAYQLYDQFGGEVFSVSRQGNELLAGTGKGLARINLDNGQVRLPEGFPYGVVLAIAFHDGYYWLGTESGLIRYDGRDYLPVPLDRMATGDFIFALYSDGKTLWIGAGTGIYYYHNARVSKVKPLADELFASVYAISPADDGSLWFATYTQGLYRYHASEWQNIRSLGGLSLDSLRFSCFSAVSANELYLGTLSEGVFYVNNEGFKHITAEQLNYAEVRAMASRARGPVWLSTNKGIYELSWTNGQPFIEHLRPSQALMDEGSISQALYVDADKVLAGTENGLLRIDLAGIERPRKVPRLEITGIELFYGQIEALAKYADGVAPFTRLPVGLTLPHDLNFISFTLSGLTGYEPENLIYRYRIDKSREWTLAGNRREAVFTNLSPGSYAFQAQVSRPGKTWGEEILQYNFRIKPPLWQQWWFILLAVLFFGGALYGYLRMRIKRINQRLRLENSLVDMERKALRLQMNPHFIFNALDSISSFIFRNDVEQAVRYLNNFAKLMRLTLESSMEHLHPVESEVSILKNYLELEKLRFQGKLEYEIEVTDDIDYDVGIPPMLIQPHVENAILHGIKPKDGPGKVWIRFYIEKEQLVCEIEDDGIGRERSRDLQKRRDHRSMATEINRHRLELLKKSLGGTVEISIKDKKNASGTLVRISLPAEQY